MLWCISLLLSQSDLMLMLCYGLCQVVNGRARHDTADFTSSRSFKWDRRRDGAAGGPKPIFK